MRFYKTNLTSIFTVLGAVYPKRTLINAFYHILLKIYKLLRIRNSSQVNVDALSVHVYVHIYTVDVIGSRQWRREATSLPRWLWPLCTHTSLACLFQSDT